MCITWMMYTVMKDLLTPSVYRWREAGRIDTGREMNEEETRRKIA